MPPLDPQRRPRRRAFVRVVVALALAIHAPFALAAAAPFAWAGLRWPLAWGTGVAVCLAALIRARLRPLMWDRPRGAWEALWERPYLAHLAACLGAAPVTLLAAPVARIVAPAHVLDVAFAVYAAFSLLTAYGTYVLPGWVRVRRLEVSLPGLSPEFDGLRIAHLSDLHVGGLLGARAVARWVELVRREDVDLVAVTGDLVTSGTAFHEEAARVVASFPARLGVFLSFGNHDYFDNDDLAARLRARGVCALKNARHLVSRGAAVLCVAGVDDTWTGRADLDATLEGTRDVPTVLLAHDPDLFDDAAALGAGLVLSGHTHAGQIAVPFFARELSLANLAHAYRWGRYSRGPSTLVVSAGLGTTGLPLRVGAAPELAIITLRAPRS
ncbi:MAG: metallophosphoesterase [Polyangiaceae bacterium]|nr:metallophosphoesterase [Polyangiaceae bacterium]